MNEAGTSSPLPQLEFEITHQQLLNTLAKNGLLPSPISGREGSNEQKKSLIQTSLKNEDGVSELEVARTNLSASEANLKVFWNSASGFTKDKVFFAQKGIRFDSHSLASQAISAGALFVGEVQKILDSDPKIDRSWILEQVQNSSLIEVSNDRLALNVVLEAIAKSQPLEFFSAAVTGTNGKTSLTQILGQMAATLGLGPSLRLGTLGIQLGDKVYDSETPTMPVYSDFLSALDLAKKAQINNVFFEATSQGLHQSRLGTWQVNTALFTNLTQDHLDYHVNMENYLKAKCLLFTKHTHPSGHIVLNANDRVWERILEIIAAIPERPQIIGVGFEKEARDFLGQFRAMGFGCEFLVRKNETCSLKGLSGSWAWFQNNTNNTPVGSKDVPKSPDEHSYHSPLIGQFQLENLSLAAACFAAQGQSLPHLCDAVSNLKGIPGRLERVPSQQHQPTVVVDYAHSPDSLEQTLRTCRNLTQGGGKVICVFGCGGDRDKTKRPIMGGLAAQLADFNIVTSDNPRTEDPQSIISDIMSGVPDERMKFFEIQADRRVAIARAVSLGKGKDIVVIAGKGHEDYQIVGKDVFPFDDRLEAQKALGK